MRILSYFAAACSIAVGVVCLVMVAKFLVFFEDGNMTLPVITQWIINTSGWIPALILFVLAIALVVLASLNQQKAAMITSYATLTVILITVVVVPFALMLPFAKMVKAMETSDEASNINDYRVKYPQLMECDEAMCSAIRMLQDLTIKNLVLEDIPAHEAIGDLNRAAKTPISFVVRIKREPAPVSLSRAEINYVQAVDEICRKANMQWKLEFDGETQRPVLIVRANDLISSTRKLPPELLDPPPDDFGDGWWAPSPSWKGDVMPDLSNWIDGYDRVELVLYDYTVDIDRRLVLDGEMHKGLAPEYTTTLNTMEAGVLIEAITGDNGSRTTGLCGFMPHHGFVFYDQKDQVAGHLEICFSCFEYISYPREGLSSTWDMNAIQKLVQSKGIPIRGNPADWKAFFADREQRLNK